MSVEPAAPRDDRTAHFLKLQLWVVLTESVAPVAQLMNALDDHLDYMIDLERRGLLFASGPLFGPGHVMTGRGLTILRAASIKEAEALAAGDPFNARGFRTFTVQEWQLNEGSFTVTVRYSDQSYQVG
jgi:uncharacterized protein YciI